ncbi:MULTISPECIES: hydantoinase/oxoprolinase family protein [Pseudomonadota]|jgi:N-methylhydantoinase A|uniref:hydantoinase/oxoprolinase family protein n=1 Tax=Pseudomonadota TaxID=1224 RepID=UPI00076A08A6|nr:MULTISPECIES: hydantoinase/oxoprolinase family protein [Pseudomonadota]MAF61771.1 5-oxoprolinase [Blastomonas sp.]|tara:strand:+ start:17105 stop:19153 length:2049 start_codon:yes stop_codon:yes gene_type:complete
MSYRLGVDVGGTFTDLLLFDEQSGAFWRHKTPSTPHDSSEGILIGVQAICAKAGITPADVEIFLHGTTVATNAVLEGKGARVGLIVTEGYRQVMQIARSFVPGGLAGWIVWPKPTPLAALEDTVEIKGRMSAQGSEIRPTDDADIRAALEKLKGQGIEALTVSLMNAYLNGAHEKRVAELAAEILPDVPISLSHVVLPEMQEYERTLTTVANAAVRPVVGRYVRNLRSRLRDAGMAGKLALLRSDGGLMSSEKSEEHPVSLLMSGPAGGVTGAIWVGKNAGIHNILTLDVGGTSTDVALIENLEARRVRTTEVGHLSVRASALDVKTVGAGGGSIAYVPELTGALRVGPQSAGAVPGPVAYGKGGELPTVTDANVVLGYLPEALLGGTFKLDREGAKKAVQTIADALGIDLYAAARGIIDIVNENMFGALRMISVQQGYDPRDFALMGFGGAGPLHVNAVARLMGSWPAISPVSPGVLCALGDATTRMRTETARSFSRLASQTTLEELGGILDEMAAQIGDELVAEGVAKDDVTITFEVDVRYAGQAFEVPMSVTRDDLHTHGIEWLTGRFDEEHHRLFTFNMDSEHEIVNLRAVAMGKALDLPAAKLPQGNGDPSAAKLRDHELWMGGAMVPAIIYDRSKLLAGDVIPGPAIVIEMDSTTLIEADCTGTVDSVGNILITLK